MNSKSTKDGNGYEVEVKKTNCTQIKVKFKK